MMVGAWAWELAEHYHPQAVQFWKININLQCLCFLTAMAWMHVPQSSIFKGMVSGVAVLGASVDLRGGGLLGGP